MNVGSATPSHTEKGSLFCRAKYWDNLKENWMMNVWLCRRRYDQCRATFKKVFIYFSSKKIEYSKEPLLFQSNLKRILVILLRLKKKRIPLGLKKDPHFIKQMRIQKRTLWFSSKRGFNWILLRITKTLFIFQRIQYSHLTKLYLNQLLISQCDLIKGQDESSV